MKKLVKVIMLQAANPRDMCCFNFITNTRNEINHLYFISNNEIKVGDYYFDPNLNEIRLKQRAEGSLSTEKKVVASTDKSLNLPLIPQSFVEWFVSSNDNITEINVEILDSIVIYDLFKKQTMEEAAIDYTNTPFIKGNTYEKLVLEAFKAGANWQSNNQ